jgi:protein phosphatase
MKLNCFETVELSDIGKKRKNNEDACLRIPEKGVYCVADGMGGAVGGDLASAAIIDRLRKVFVEEPAATESFAGHVALFRQAANAASRWIKEFADDKVVGQMGSTLVALVFDPENPKRAVGLHAGDSRLYRYRNGQLQLLTADHTAAAALAATLGRDASQIPNKFHNELVKAVGLAETVELEKTMVDVAKDDLFLLCSDGLTRMMPEEVITAALKSTSAAPLDQVAKTLIAGANEAGGKDNVTVVLIKMGDLSGFSDVFEPVNLEESHALDPHAGLESDTLSVTKLGGPHTSDSSLLMHGHTPETAEAGPMHGDTPSDDHSGGMRGDTPQTDDAHDPPTPPTAQPQFSPKGADENKLVLRKGRMAIAAIIAVTVIAGVYFHFRDASRSPASNGGNLSQHAAPVPAPAPAPVKQETPPPPPPTGGVAIQSEPSGAAVYLEGKQVGVTPFQTNGLPAGQVSYELGTATQSGKVVLSIIGGQTNSTNVTLQTRMGAFAIESDPPGAEVWFGDQDKGKTPVTGEWPVGQATVVLKAAGLKDQVATMTIGPSEAYETNVVFAYGGVVIQSEPAGAEVLQNGKVIGHTPYTDSVLPPGWSSWQLAVPGWQTANVSVDVADHQTKQETVHLQKEQGVLRLAGNLPGITAKVDGVDAGLLPVSAPVEAGVDHTVTAQFKGVEKTNTARVNSNQTNVLEFTFKEEPVRWTNSFLDMVFVKVPDAGVWAAVNRVTREQFAKVMAGLAGAAQDNEDNGQRYVVNLTSAMTKSFAAKLTGAAAGNGRPDEIKNYHFALPTTNQWMLTFANAEKLGIQMTNLKTDREWCLDNNTWYMAGYVLQGTNFYPRPGYKPINPPPGEDPKLLALRLVLVP